jgi:hypothetical protein
MNKYYTSQLQFSYSSSFIHIAKKLYHIVPYFTSFTANFILETSPYIAQRLPYSGFFVEENGKRKKGY